MERATALSPSTRRLFPHRFAQWQAQGLSARAASAVALAGCDTVEEIARLGRSHFENVPNLGEKSLAQLATLAGWPEQRRTAVDTIAQALSMAMDPQEAREAAADVMSALRCAGYALTVTPKAHARA
jgi:hypothetical protein